MASIFKNGYLWWIKARRPSDGALVRLSLGTSSRPEADLLLQKWEATVALLRPEFSIVEFPPTLAGLLSDPSRAVLPLKPPTEFVGAPASVSATIAPVPSLARVLSEFSNFCRSENALHHAQSKEGILKAAFGAKCLASDPKIDGPLAAEFLHELTASAVESFVIARRNRKGEVLARKSKHHYREVFVQLFNFALKRSYYLPTNIAYPNPMSALPSWNDHSHTIVFLKPMEVTEQLNALKDNPVLHAAAATLIYAGPRRGEGLWLRRDSLKVSQPGTRYLSVRSIRDEKTDKQGTLKTPGSARSVPLTAELAAILDPYLLTHKSDWLFPAPKGGRWDKDHFSQALAKANKAAGLPWSAGHYRHTYATMLASSGYSVFALAKQMGTSIQMIMRHYAAFFPPEATR